MTSTSETEINNTSRQVSIRCNSKGSDVIFLNRVQFCALKVFYSTPLRGLEPKIS